MKCNTSIQRTIDRDILDDVYQNISPPLILDICFGKLYSRTMSSLESSVCLKTEEIYEKKCNLIEKIE